MACTRAALKQYGILGFSPDQQMVNVYVKSVQIPESLREKRLKLQPIVLDELNIGLQSKPWLVATSSVYPCGSPKWT